MAVRYIMSSVCLRLSQFSQLSSMQYVGLCVFSLPIYLMLIVRLHVWPICHCLGLCYETMICAVCLSILFDVYANILQWWSILCVSTTEGRRRDGGGWPRRVRGNGSWSHFSVPPRGAVAVWRQLASIILSIEAAIWILKILWSLLNWTCECAVVLHIRPSDFKAIGELYQSPGFDISWNLEIKHLNSLLIAKRIAETFIIHVVLYAWLVWLVCLCSYTLLMWLKIREQWHFCILWIS